LSTESAVNLAWPSFLDARGDVDVDAAALVATATATLPPAAIVVTLDQAMQLPPMTTDPELVRGMDGLVDGELIVDLPAGAVGWLEGAPVFIVESEG
jgi:hypothetical protein